MSTYRESREYPPREGEGNSKTLMLRSDPSGSRLEACDVILRDGVLRLLRMRVSGMWLL
jgi:hypothetical protein